MLLDVVAGKEKWTWQQKCTQYPQFLGKRAARKQAERANLQGEKARKANQGHVK
jgi:hypothetical protein